MHVGCFRMFYLSQWTSFVNQHVVYVHQRYLVAVLTDGVICELVIFVLSVQRSLVLFLDTFFVGQPVAVVLAALGSLVAFYLDRP